MQHWVDNDRELFSFIKYVLLYAPNRFPNRDFLAPDEQLNLDKAFDELNRGLEFLPKRQRDDAMLMQQLKRLLADSLQAYKQGDDVQGGKVLNEFDLLAFSKTWQRIEESDRGA